MTADCVAVMIQVRDEILNGSAADYKPGVAVGSAASRQCLALGTGAAADVGSKVSNINPTCVTPRLEDQKWRIGSKGLLNSYSRMASGY